MVKISGSMPEQAELTESRSSKVGREVIGGDANSSECSGSSHSINDAHSPPIATPLKRFDTEPASLGMDSNQEWEIRNIVGRKAAGGILLVDWEPTLMAEFELDGARELCCKWRRALLKAMAAGD
jgi:hypothetical protein